MGVCICQLGTLWSYSHASGFVVGRSFEHFEMESVIASESFPCGCECFLHFCLHNTRYFFLQAISHSNIGGQGPACAVLSEHVALTHTAELPPRQNCPIEAENAILGFQHNELIVAAHLMRNKNNKIESVKRYSLGELYYFPK